MGIDRLSITPAAVGPIKAMVRSLDRAALMQFFEQALMAPGRSLREPLTSWAQAHSVELA